MQRLQILLIAPIVILATGCYQGPGFEFLDEPGTSGGEDPPEPNAETGEMDDPIEEGSSGGTTTETTGAEETSDGTTTTATTGAEETSDGTTTSATSGQDDCEATGGVWDPNACGHYVCGIAPDCDAIEPGCDCGEGSRFVEGVGCVAHRGCVAVELECGEDVCDAPSQYCGISVPAERGSSDYACKVTPADCVDDYSCECFDVDASEECEEGQGGITLTTFSP